MFFDARPVAAGVLIALWVGLIALSSLRQLAVPLAQGRSRSTRSNMRRLAAGMHGAAKCTFSFDFSRFCSSDMITFLPVCLLSRGSETRSSQSGSGAPWGVTPTSTIDASNYTILNPLSSPTDTVAQCLQSLVDAQVSALHKPNTYRP